MTNQQNRCVPSEDDLNQPGHSLTSLCCPCKETAYPKMPIERIKQNSHMSGRIPRLI